MLDAALRDRPDAEAVLSRSGSLTYAQLDAQADRAAAGLWSLGVRPGDRVAASLPNDQDVVVAFHGAMRIGAIWVGIGEALAPPERAHLLDDSKPAVYLTAEDNPLLDAMADAPEAPAVEIDVHAPAGIAYTSGTTGVPKGIVHSQHNLLLPGEVLVASRGWGPDLRKGDCLPLTILNLMVLTTLLTAQAQGCCVVMDRRDADGIAEWIERGRVTVWNGVPAQLHDLVTTKRVDPARLRSLREVWSGGGDCPESLRTAFEDCYGLSIRTTYGLTEAPTVVSIDPVGTERREGASGQVLPHLEVSTGDGEGEITVSARADGDWAGRWRPYLGTWDGHGVAPNRDAVLATGDVGTVESGWLSVRDRLKLLIVRGGANVYPAEVERVLLGVDGIAGAAVFGVPDARLGERVGAVVELSGGVAVDVETLREACATALAAYKVPERFAIVDALPRNAMGKVVRTGLVDLLAASGGSDT
ncbi:MAG: AMP-binding protein [Frankiaceae bacterium]|nr:AMP-binding protein [Frankiaceae bacterium]